MVNFDRFKLTEKDERFDWLYRCKRCGHECWYVIDLPQHMLRHLPEFRWSPKCFGTLELVAMRRREP